MADNELRIECGECGTELKEGNKNCPNCGSTKKLFKKTLVGTIHPSANLTATHEFRWSGTAWTILGIFLTLLATIFFGLCSFNALLWWVNIFISLGIVILLFVFIWWRSYQIVRFLRWLEGKFTGRKTYHSK